MTLNKALLEPSQVQKEKREEIMSAKEATPKPRILMVVDKPNIDAMEKKDQSGVTPKRLFELGTVLGDLVYWVTFVDRRITDAEFEKWDKAGFDQILCPRIHVHTRHEHIGEQQPKTISKETVDNRLIEGVRRMARFNKIDQVILVAGDSDYLPVVRSLVFDDRVGVWLFLTSKGPLMSADFGPLLLDRHLLFEDKRFTYPATDMASFRTVPTTKELHRVAPEIMTQLFLHSEECILCTNCEEPVPIGLLKIHKCHPNRYLQSIGCPICKQKVPFDEWKEHPCHNIKQVENDDGTLTLLVGRKPSLQPESVPTSSPPISIDEARLRELRTSVDSLDAMPNFNDLVGALRKAPIIAALDWLIDRKDRRCAFDASEVLAGAINNAQLTFIAHWVETLVHIRSDAFAGQYPCEEAKKLITEWMDMPVDWEAIALLIQRGVLKTDNKGMILRGSLMHPVYLLKPISRSLKVT
jgi:hypothetical protein